jgi:hypothetical protein
MGRPTASATATVSPAAGISSAASGGSGAVGTGWGGGTGVAGASGATAAGAGLPAAVASNAAISGVSSPSGSAPVVPRPVRIAFTRSNAVSTRLIMSGVTARAQSRTLPSTLSPACATRSRRGRPRKPQVPLIVCTMRKISASVAASSGVRSSVTKARSSSAKFSLVSVRKSASKSSMVPSLRPELGVSGGILDPG